MPLFGRSTTFAVLFCLLSASCHRWGSGDGVKDGPSQAAAPQGSLALDQVLRGASGLSLPAGPSGAHHPWPADEPSQAALPSAARWTDARETVPVSPGMLAQLRPVSEAAYSWFESPSATPPPPG
jgi:hypothetical protein